MNEIPTPHIAAKSKEDFASTVLMPGDPLRAQFIAENYLDKAKLVSDIRGMLAYTGEYSGKRISVMASGMGMPSIGIYSYELFKFYQVERILRIGSCGALHPELKLGQTLLVTDAWTQSTFAKQQNGSLSQILPASASFNQLIKKVAMQNNYLLSMVRAHCTDVFYSENFHDFEVVRDQNACDVVEMESYALFTNAVSTNKQAAVLLTVSDNLVSREQLSVEARRSGFVEMIKLALEVAIIS